MSSKDTDEECLMHLKSDNIEIMISDKADELIKELFESLLSRYQIGLETIMIMLIIVLQVSHNKYESRRILYKFSRFYKNKKAKINPIN